MFFMWAWSKPASAQIFMGPNSQKQAEKAARKEKKIELKNAKKQQKAMKKYAKAQRKAERKMLKTERKNTKYPSQHAVYSSE